MQTVMLNTKTAMPAIGFGTWQIFPNGRAQRATNEALTAGYRLIDTARIYGNERGVGRAIRERTDIPREEIFITTKLWNSDHGYEKAIKAHDKSLTRLGMEYTDLYLIHWPVKGKRLESWRALCELYKCGRTKAIGVSNYTIQHLEELMSKFDIVPAVNQVEFHPYLYEDQAPLLEFCKRHNIVIEAYSPLAHGRKDGEDRLLEMTAKYNKSSAQLILKWCLQHGTVPLPKTRNPQHMIENITLSDFELTPDEISLINSFSDGTRTFWNPTSNS